MPNREATINSRNYDGTIRRTWKCELVEQTDDLLIFVGVFDRDVEHADLGFIEKGTISYEYYWLGRCYNIFRFHESDGTFRNYYCNINLPPTFIDGVLDYVDLDIDIVVWPGGSIQELDRDEYEENARKFGFSKAMQSRVEESITELRSIITSRELPI